MKVYHGLPDGPYTLYKFVITFNHQYYPINPHSEEGGDDDDDESEPPRIRTSHWSIKKRYSDFVTFNSNLMAEIKGLDVDIKTVKLPKLPPKTFKKNFSASFVSSRHNALLLYLNKIIMIRGLASSVTLLTFLGAVSPGIVHNDKFLDSRMTLSVYVSNYADSGDVLLFETKSYIAASLRSVTASNYDHVALVFRDIDGTHKNKKSENDGNAQNVDPNGLYLMESTIDGVRTYPLKNRLKQWNVLCPCIVVRRLKLLKEGVQQKKMTEWTSSSSLNSLPKNKKYRKYDQLYTKYDYAIKDEAFYSLAAEFVEKVDGLDYAIWTNVFKNDVPLEKQKSFFCSQLVTAFFKFMQLLPQNVRTNRILPGHFSDDEANENKLPLKNCVLIEENLLLFKQSSRR